MPYNYAYVWQSNQTLVALGHDIIKIKVIAKRT